MRPTNWPMRMPHSIISRRCRSWTATVSAWWACRWAAAPPLRVAATVHGRAKTDYEAAVAYYPYCFDYLYSFDVPVKILIGADDDWTPARLCSAVASRDPDHVDLTIYPDTHHSFDLPMGGAICH